MQETEHELRLQLARATKRYTCRRASGKGMRPWMTKSPHLSSLHCKQLEKPEALFSNRPHGFVLMDDSGGNLILQCFFQDLGWRRCAGDLNPEPSLSRCLDLIVFLLIEVWGPWYVPCRTLCFVQSLFSETLGSCIGLIFGFDVCDAWKQTANSKAVRRFLTSRRSCIVLKLHLPKSRGVSCTDLRFSSSSTSSALRGCSESGVEIFEQQFKV